MHYTMEFRPCWEPKTESDSGDSSWGTRLWVPCLYSDELGVSAQSRALWPNLRQVAHLCLKVHVPGYAHLPLFQDMQILSNVLGRILWEADWRDDGWLSPFELKGVFPCTDWRAHSSLVWSTSWHKLQNIPYSERDPKNVERTRLALRALQGIVGSAATRW